MIFYFNPTFHQQFYLKYGTFKLKNSNYLFFFFFLRTFIEVFLFIFLRKLADINQDGFLSQEEFAIAMHLVYAKLAGQEVPIRLPLGLIPPTPVQV